MRFQVQVNSSMEDPFKGFVVSLADLWLWRAWAAAAAAAAEVEAA